MWANWPMGGAWLCQHLWEHYAFNGDKGFLRRVYPVLKGAAEFYLGWLVADPQGRLTTCPSTSPENRFRALDGRPAQVCSGATMDLALTREVFTNCIAASRVLGLEAGFRKRLEETLPRLLPYQTGSRGQLLEWSEDFEEPEPGHRHVAHLSGLHPGDQITLRGTPELAKAARTSLELRLKAGSGHTGWSRTWIINFWARLEEAGFAWENVTALLNKSTLPNMFDTHPPFQIDGNFGGAMGIAEMLLQSQAGVVHLLPALPRAWNVGSVNGLRARGGYAVDIAWQDGKLTRAVLRSTLSGSCKLRAPARVGVRAEGRAVPMERGADDPLVVVFRTRAGRTYEISPEA